MDNSWLVELESVSQELHHRFDPDVAQSAIERVLRFVAKRGTVPTNLLYYTIRAAKNCQIDQWRVSERIRLHFEGQVPLKETHITTQSGAAMVEARIALSQVPKDIRAIFMKPRSQRTAAEHSRLCRFQKRHKVLEAKESASVV